MAAGVPILISSAPPHAFPRAPAGGAAPSALAALCQVVALFGGGASPSGPPCLVCMENSQWLREAGLDGWVWFGGEVLEQHDPFGPCLHHLLPHSPLWSWLVAQTALGWQGI